MPANLENSAEATGLEKVSFHSNPKEIQWNWTICTLNGTNSPELTRQHEEDSEREMRVK